MGIYIIECDCANVVSSRNNILHLIMPAYLGRFLDVQPRANLSTTLK